MRLTGILITLPTLILLGCGAHQVRAQTQIRTQAETLIIYAEDALPFAYLTKGRVTGPATEYVREAAIRAGYRPEIRLASWSAIIKRAEQEKNVIFYPMARTPERENQYQWLGRLCLQKNYALYKRKDRKDLNLHSLQEARQFKIGIIQDDARAQYLQKNGFTELKNGDSSGLIKLVNNDDGLRLLKSGRIDLLPLSIANFTGYCKADCNHYEVAFPLDIAMDLQLAAGKNVAADTVQRLKLALQSMQKEGLYPKPAEKSADQLPDKPIDKPTLSASK